MAQGDVISNSNAKHTVCLATGLTAANAAPTLVTDGIPVFPTNKISADDGHCFTANPAITSTLALKLGGTTPSFTVKLWGYLAATATWYPIADAINAAAAVTANYSQRLNDLGHWDRLYLQATAASGTTPTLDAQLTTSRTISF